VVYGVSRSRTSLEGRLTVVQKGRDPAGTQDLAKDGTDLAERPGQPVPDVVDRGWAGGVTAAPMAARSSSSRSR
jgi:hypothetical protein